MKFLLTLYFACTTHGCIPQHQQFPQAYASAIQCKQAGLKWMSFKPDSRTKVIAFMCASDKRN